VKKLHIQFTRPVGFKLLSWLIRVVQGGTSYSHVRLCWVNSVGVPIVYEASGSSVKFLGPKAGDAVVVNRQYVLEVDKEQYRKLVRICMLYAGVSYGVWQVINIGLKTLFGLTLPGDGDNTIVCSELVARVLEEGLGFNLPYNFDKVTPKELEQWCSKNL